MSQGQGDRSAIIGGGVAHGAPWHYNYFRDYDPAIGRYIQSDPIGLDSDLNTYAYVRGQPLNQVDPLGLASISVSLCVVRAFHNNYRDMTNAIGFPGRDKFFHCKANCEAAQCGKGAADLACDLSDFREWRDQQWPKNYPKSDSDEDQYANRYGRGWGSMTRLDCFIVCEPFRPVGLGRGPYSGFPATYP